MDLTPLSPGAGLEGYDRQAHALLDAWRAGEAGALQVFRRCHPRFLDAEIPWLPLRLSDQEVRATALDLRDARLAVARRYDFDGWERLAEHVAAAAQEGSAVLRFELAAEAVVDGDLAALESLLATDPALVHARSSRVTHFDPPVHRATLLHYVAANGVESYRQRTPPNAVAVARLLLERGAAPDALAELYGGRLATLSLLVSSSPVAGAGLQVPLIDALVDFGAALEPRGSGEWASPLMTALAFSFRDAAAALVRRGAPVEGLAAAAGLGLFAEAERMLPQASVVERQRALALGAQLGQLEVVRLLLDAGVDPDRYNPRGNHAHSTPLHQAVWAGEEAVVRLLVDRGARLDLRDTIYAGTPLGWAEHGRRTAIAEYLRSRGAP